MALAAPRFEVTPVVMTERFSAAIRTEAPSAAFFIAKTGIAPLVETGRAVAAAIVPAGLETMAVARTERTAFATAVFFERARTVLAEALAEGPVAVAVPARGPVVPRETERPALALLVTGGKIVPIACLPDPLLLRRHRVQGLAAQRLDLLGSQITPTAGLEIAELKPVERHAHQGDDIETDLRAHLADLAVPPLVKDEAQHGMAPGELVQDGNFDRTEEIAVDIHRRLQGPEDLLVAKPRHLDMIDLLVVVARMGDVGDQVAVVGKQEKAAAVLVKPPHGDEAGGDGVDELRDATPAVTIARRAQIPDGLVQHDGALFPGQLGQGLVVYEDFLLGGIDLYAHLTYDISIDAHASVADHFLRMAA